MEKCLHGNSDLVFSLSSPPSLSPRLKKGLLIILFEHLISELEMLEHQSCYIRTFSHMKEYASDQSRILVADLS